MGEFYSALVDDLILFVRQSAWLNASPELPPNSKAERITRLEKMRRDRKDDSYHPEMPPVDAPHLLAYLFEVGPVMAAGMGAGPITHEELQAWQRSTGIELHPWEARTLRRLSHEYLSESHKAEKADYPSPWDGEKPDPKIAARVLREHMESLVKLGKER